MTKKIVTEITGWGTVPNDKKDPDLAHDALVVHMKVIAGPTPLIDREVVLDTTISQLERVLGMRPLERK